MRGPSPPTPRPRPEDGSGSVPVYQGLGFEKVFWIEILGGARALRSRGHALATAWAQYHLCLQFVPRQLMWRP